MNEIKAGDRATVVLNAPIPQYFHVEVESIQDGFIKIVQPLDEDMFLPKTFNAETGKDVATGLYHLKPYMHQHANI